MPWEAIQIDEEEQVAFDRAFRKEVKFYAEDGVEQVIIDIMLDLGFKVTTARDVGLSGRDDAEHLAYAFGADRVLLTKDRDFLNDRKHPPYKSPGIVVLDIDPLGRQSLEDAIYLLKLVIRPYREIWRRSKILISKDRHITVWQREHDTGRWQKTRYLVSKNGQPLEWVE